MNYSGFWRRFFAYVIDGFILSVPALIFDGVLQSIWMDYGMHTILSFLYYPFFESSVMSATPGKALLGMVVLTESGERISFKVAVIRFFGRYLSWLLLGLGYLMQLFTTKRQTLHDMLSETIVINRPSEDFNYFIVWRDQFKEITNKL